MLLSYTFPLPYDFIVRSSPKVDSYFELDLCLHLVCRDVRVTSALCLFTGPRMYYNIIVWLFFLFFLHMLEHYSQTKDGNLRKYYFKYNNVSVKCLNILLTVYERGDISNDNIYYYFTLLVTRTNTYISKSSLAYFRSLQKILWVEKKKSDWLFKLHIKDLRSSHCTGDCWCVVQFLRGCATHSWWRRDGNIGECRGTCHSQLDTQKINNT